MLKNTLLASFLIAGASRSIFCLPGVFHEPDKGNNPPAPAPKGTLEEQLASARSDLTRVQAELSTAQGQVTAITAERDNLQNQFSALTTEATGLRSQVTTLQGQVTALTGERDTLNATLGTVNANVTRLEALCGVKGIDPKTAVPTSSAPSAPDGALTVKSFDARLASAKDDTERNKILAEFGEAATAGKIVAA